MVNEISNIDRDTFKCKVIGKLDYLIKLSGLYYNDLEYKILVDKISDIYYNKFIDILYPLDIFIVYHLYYRYSTQIVNEAIADSLFNNFIRKQDIVKYREIFEGSVNANVKNIVMLRVAIATFADIRDKLNFLPLSKFRYPSLDFIGLNCNACVDEVRNKYFEVIRNSCVDDIILGRLGYLMVWHWHNKQGELSDIPLLN